MKGLLPRMEARRRKGGFTYRYHPLGGKPINLGQDLQVALRKVLDMNGRSSDAGSVQAYWRAYQGSHSWNDLAPRTKTDYAEYSVPLLKVFGAAAVRSIRSADVARYLRRERSSAPVRANREVALLSNILNVALEDGAIEVNPCYGVRRNKEHARKDLPIAAELERLLTWLRQKGTQWRVIAAMAEFAARSGARRTEFLRATVFQVRGLEARLGRAKQRRGNETTDVIELSPLALQAILEVRRDNCEYLFPNRFGEPYTDNGFHTMWKKAIKAALAESIISARFTFHDLRAHYTTVHKDTHGALPNLHKDPGVTARVYDRHKEVRRKAL